MDFDKFTLRSIKVRILLLCVIHINANIQIYNFGSLIGSSKPSNSARKVYVRINVNSQPVQITNSRKDVYINTDFIVLSYKVFNNSFAILDVVDLHLCKIKILNFENRKITTQIIHAVFQSNQTPESCQSYTMDARELQIPIQNYSRLGVLRSLTESINLAVGINKSNENLKKNNATLTANIQHSNIYKIAIKCLALNVSEFKSSPHGIKVKLKTGKGVFNLYNNRNNVKYQNLYQTNVFGRMESLMFIRNEFINAGRINGISKNHFLHKNKIENDLEVYLDNKLINANVFDDTKKDNEIANGKEKSKNIATDNIDEKEHTKPGYIKDKTTLGFFFVLICVLGFMFITIPWVYLCLNSEEKIHQYKEMK